MANTRDIIMITVSLIIMGIVLPIGIGLISAAGSQTVEIQGYAEISEVEFNNFDNTNGNDTLHFTIITDAGDNEEHYIWFAKDGNDADPNESGTAHEVDIDGNVTDTDIRDSVYSVLNDLDIEATFQKLSGAWLRIVNDNNGDVEDANQVGTSISSIVIYQDGRAGGSSTIDDLADSTVLMLLTVLVPILTVVGIAIGLIPKIRG